VLLLVCAVHCALTQMLSSKGKFFLNTLLFGGRGFIKYQLTYFTGKRENFVLKRKQEVIPLGNLCLRIYDAKY
jgi:hypothetical protein